MMATYHFSNCCRVSVIKLNQGLKLTWNKKTNEKEGNVMKCYDTLTTKKKKWCQVWLSMENNCTGKPRQKKKRHLSLPADRQFIWTRWGMIWENEVSFLTHHFMDLKHSHGIVAVRKTGQLKKSEGNRERERKNCLSRTDNWMANNIG